MPQHAVNPDTVAPPLSNYSHAVRVDLGTATLVFISGQVAYENDRVVGEGDMGRQAEYCYQQLQAIMEDLGGTMGDIVKTNTYLTDMRRIGELAAARTPFFAEPLPTSTTVEVTKLARDGLLVEVEAIAVIGKRDE